MTLLELLEAVEFVFDYDYDGITCTICEEPEHKPGCEMAKWISILKASQGDDDLKRLEVSDG